MLCNSTAPHKSRQYWLDCAANARKNAANATTDNARGIWLENAEHYERNAKRAKA